MHATWETLCRGAEMLQMKMPLRCGQRSAGHGKLTANDLRQLSAIAHGSTINESKATTNVFMGYSFDEVQSKFTSFFTRLFDLNPNQEALVDDKPSPRV